MSGSKWYRVELDHKSLTDEDRKEMSPHNHRTAYNYLMRDMDIQNRVKFTFRNLRDTHQNATIVNRLVWIFKFKCPIEATAFKLRWT